MINLISKLNFLNEKLKVDEEYSNTGGNRIVKILSINNDTLDIIDTKGHLSGKKTTMNKEKFIKDFYKCTTNN